MALKIILYVAGALVGGLGGFFYWKQVGCASGTCPITSSPIFSTIFGVILGLLLSSLFIPAKASVRTTETAIPETVAATPGSDQTKPAPVAEIYHLTKSEFLKKVADFEKNPDTWNYLGDKPAIVDFYADWCGPCKRLAPVLESLAKEYAGKMILYKVDTEKEPELASAFGVRSIPTLLFIPMKGNPQISVGALPEVQLRRAMKEVMKVE